MSDELPDPGPLQFGRREPGADPADRPCAYGVARRADGRIAVVRVEKDGTAWLDLPGGALDPGEDEPQALVREFGEETGLVVRAGALIARADQFMVKTDGQAVNNRSGLYETEVVGERPDLKIEADHTLEWIDPVEAMTKLRHGSHAWAVAAWMRVRRARG